MIFDFEFLKSLLIEKNIFSCKIEEFEIFIKHPLNSKESIIDMSIRSLKHRFYDQVSKHRCDASTQIEIRIYKDGFWQGYLSSSISNYYRITSGDFPKNKWGQISSDIFRSIQRNKSIKSILS